MSFRLEIRPAAVEDIANAATWYEDREPGLGERFIGEVVATVDRVLPNPFLWRLRNVRLGARWCFPEHFPYRIVFRVADDLIAVVSVTHAARHDRNWKERM